MCLLILGGTADGRHLAESLHQQGVPVIYSVAGLVRTPTVDCQVVSGGFTQFGGLEQFVSTHAVAAILDVTHPHAQTMSSTAVTVAKNCDIPCWRFHRQPWQQQQGDQWQIFKNWNDLLPQLTNKKSVFLTTGQLPQDVIDYFSEIDNQQQLLRTAVKPKTELPISMDWVKAIGPFSYDDEWVLLKNHHIDALVTKNSGGDATVQKLNAARELGVPVYMLARPKLPNADKVFHSKASCEMFILTKFDCVN